MFLGRVMGHVVATAKDPSMTGTRLVVIEPLKVDYADADAAANAGETTGSSFSPTGRAIVAIDKLGAGKGQLVLIVQGSSARMAEGCNTLPTDAVVVGIVDELRVEGATLPASDAKA